MTDFLQYLFSGLTNGAIYALIALGFCVVNNTMGILNFIQVDFVSLGGMLMFSALFAIGLPMVPGLLLAVAGVALAAMLIERFGLRPARSDNHLILVFLTVGLSIILRGFIKLVWGKNRMALPPLTPDVPIEIFGASVLPQTLWILLLTFIAIILLTWFFYRTSLGLSMRAVASNPTAAAVCRHPGRSGPADQLRNRRRPGRTGRGAGHPDHYSQLRCRACCSGSRALPRRFSAVSAPFRERSSAASAWACWNRSPPVIFPALTRTWSLLWSWSWCCSSGRRGCWVNRNSTLKLMERQF